MSKKKALKNQLRLDIGDENSDEYQEDEKFNDKSMITTGTKEKDKEVLIYLNVFC